ncbi:MAG: GMC family oxidoreductase [Planctomycetota bacterium]
MIIDLNDMQNRELPVYDLCIIGSGPSGMTVAHELASTGLHICVLESGLSKHTRHGDRLRRVESQGIHIKEYSRERVLGGASTTWSGLASPLDPIDMHPRPYLRHSGWPISRDELMPFYEAAAERYRFPPLELFFCHRLEEVKRKGDLSLSWDQVEEKIFMAADEPQQFGREFKGIFDQPHVDLYLDATLIRLEAGTAEKKITHGILRTRDQFTMKVQARAFVIAAGGIENPRILLNSRDLCGAGLGNEFNQVGRYLMNHPKNYYGVIRLSKPLKELPYYLGCLYQGFAGYAGLRLKESVQERRQLLNAYVRFEPIFPWSDCRGVEALVLIAKQCKFILRSWKKGRKDEVISLRDYAETGDDTDLQNERKSFFQWVLLFALIFVHLPRVTMYLYYRLRKNAKPVVKAIRIRNFMEMEPQPENRVTLSEEKDIYGQPVPMVRHGCSEVDKRSLIELHRALEEEVLRNGLGKLVSRLQEEEPWPIIQDASHHMGTTRMGENPAISVVNADGRLHSVENVFIAGGSVFPTSGCANPTFTMVALSIRLAQHLKSHFFGKET